MNYTKLFTAVCVCLVQLSFSQQATIGSASLTNKQSILNDRAFFMFPATAENKMRGSNLMATDPNGNAETRIVWDVKDMRMVFFAQEMYSTCGGNLLELSVKEDRDDFKSRMLTTDDSLLSVLSTPLTFDTTENAILVNTLLVKTADNSVFRISAYITPAAFKEKDEFQKLSERVFSSLSKGSRKLNSKARTETWPIYEGKKKFSIAVPNGYIITKDAKYDFEVLKFHKLSEIGDTGFVSLIIYTGHHPSYFYTEQGFSSTQAEKIKGSFLDKKMEWLSFKDDKRKLYIKEQQVPYDKIGESTIIHVAMLSDKPEAIAELSSIVDHIKIEK
jgi:hypothetical protein